MRVNRKCAGFHSHRKMFCTAKISSDIFLFKPHHKQRYPPWILFDYIAVYQNQNKYVRLKTPTRVQLLFAVKGVFS